MIGSRLRSLRAENKVNQEELGKRLGVGKTTISQYESETRKPDSDMLIKIAAVFDVTVDYLLGRTNERNQPYYALTPKDERDVARDLERMMSDLESKEAMAFYGEPIDDEERELLRRSLENSLMLAKQIAKKKFTPKKYR